MDWFHIYVCMLVRMVQVWSSDIRVIIDGPPEMDNVV